ncbi:hypothetical protein [Hyphomonas sp. UBA4494]|jgi:hypothetical protein|uniref:hypothetical protein n=1 Tax=Hyphomonas sp. UBA4494 TaxID=1946631 RepID=UPI0025C39A15|nr:hypothetical protein [Hyphomonas sp. UBA4494]
MPVRHTIPLNDPSLREFERISAAFIAAVRNQVLESFEAAGISQGPNETDENFVRRTRMSMLLNGWVQVTRGVLEQSGLMMPADDFKHVVDQFIDIQTQELPPVDGSLPRAS